MSFGVDGTLYCFSIGVPPAPGDEWNWIQGIEAVGGLVVASVEPWLLFGWCLLS